MLFTDDCITNKLLTNFIFILYTDKVIKTNVFVWKINLNVKKYVRIKCREKNSIHFAYIISNEIIKVRSSVKYLGVTLSTDLLMKELVEMIALKTIRAC